MSYPERLTQHRSDDIDPPLPQPYINIVKRLVKIAKDAARADLSD